MMDRFVLSLLFVLFSAVSMAAYAEVPKLIFPLDCRLGEDCVTARYMDMNAASDVAQDYRCGGRVSEGYEGIDYALRSRVEMKAGVDVLAAAAGEVLRVRDGESDTTKSDVQIEAITAANKDCGNGVLINHGQGLQSFYCHLKKGSIKVKGGEKVSAGQVIGQVGQSGAADYPHLHFSVNWEGGRVDPYSGAMMDEGCGVSKASLWAHEMPYEPYALFDAGFEGGVPDFDAIKRGRVEVDVISAAAGALVYWVGFYHGAAGDRVELSIHAPDGSVFSQRVAVMEDNRARQFYYTGRKARGGLQAGTYKGKAVFMREGVAPKTYEHDIIVK